MQILAAQAVSPPGPYPISGPKRSCLQGVSEGTVRLEAGDVKVSWAVWVTVVGSPWKILQVVVIGGSLWGTPELIRVTTS